MSSNAAYEKIRRQKIKAEVMRKYGGQCVCCGESILAFLTIDHKLGNGAEHRRSLFPNSENPGSMPFYRHLLANPVDPDLQVMCWNCNSGKRLEPECPHLTLGLTIAPTTPL